MLVGYEYPFRRYAYSTIYVVFYFIFIFDTSFVRFAKTAQLGDRVPTEVGWWSVFIENLERYDKTNTRVRCRKGSVVVMGLSAILVTESFPKNGN